ncbi:MAG: permease [Patescibacteria group bacterium]|nr:permease [Patescibacteria group bacterium]
MFYPIKLFSDWLSFAVLRLAPESHAGLAVNFFVYDTIKVFILLAIIIFAVSVLRSFFPSRKIRDILSRQNQFVGNIFASLFGIITPFCSCSAVPLFLGFIEAGVPLGVTFSFLVASPMINEVALILLFGTFGWKIAGLYVLSGLLISIISGIIIGKLPVEHLLENMAVEEKNKINPTGIDWRKRIRYACGYTRRIIKKIWFYVIIGIGLGAWIHGYVPTNFLTQYAGADKWYAVPLATLIGIPLYSNAAGVVPVVNALAEKGVAVGTTLAFMMAVTALSLPEFMILKRIMKTKLIFIYASIVGLGIIFTGYLFNLILK